MTSQRALIRNARVVGPEAVAQGDVLMEDGLICAVGRDIKAGDASVMEANGLLALPGFIDIHCHGGRLFSTLQGIYQPEEDRFDDSREAFDRGMPVFLSSTASHGVTTLLAGTSAGPIEMICAALRRLARYCGNGHNGDRRAPGWRAAARKGPAQQEERGGLGSRLYGMFIEGAFIKQPE